jgi:hypothetical protein
MGNSMSEPLTSHNPIRRRVWPVGAIAAVGSLGLGLLWWIDPAKVNVPLCGFYALTGWHCPGCGAVRATHEVLNGRLLSALHYNVLWTLSLPLAMYLAVSELRKWAGRRPLPGDLAGKPWFWIAAAVVSLVFFALRNLPWEPFSLLAPPG